MNNKNNATIVNKMILLLISAMVAAVMSFVALPQEASAQVCYGESGETTSFNIVDCIGPGSDSLSATSCYVLVDPNGPSPSFSEIACPSNADDLGLTQWDEGSTGNTCGGVDIAIDVGCDPNSDNPITGYANAIINFLAAGVGLVVIIMVAVGGVQFMTSGGNPQATEAAIKRITNALIGLVFFIFMYAFLQWLIPGGPF